TAWPHPGSSPAPLRQIKVYFSQQVGLTTRSSDRYRDRRVIGSHARPLARTRRMPGGYLGPAVLLLFLRKPNRYDVRHVPSPDARWREFKRPRPDSRESSRSPDNLAGTDE